jgi:sugar phosphate isomerase/epimerase
MSTAPQVILSAIGDEATHHKGATEQLAALAAVGLQYYTLRSVDLGDGPKNVMQLSKAEIHQLRHLEDDYGMNVTSIGSPIGKVKLLDVEDGTKNAFIPFKKYLEKDVKRVCELAHAFETKLIRGFSFYHPKGTDPKTHLPQVVDQLGAIAETCLRSDLTFGVEIEANLVGQTGEILADIHRQVANPALMLIFDAANILVQGFSSIETYQQYEAMKPGLGWMHIKDYRLPAALKKLKHVNEETLHDFAPADVGDGAHAMILKDFAQHLPKLDAKLRRRGIPGVFLDLEPHLKSGGQFGGTSGPDGVGVALRALCKVLDFVRIDYHLRDFDDVRAER